MRRTVVVLAASLRRLSYLNGIPLQLSKCRMA